MNEGKENIKRPYLALFLSFLFPGLGQIYNGQFKKGFIISGLFIAVYMLMSKPYSIMKQSGFDNLETIDSNTMIIVFGYSIAILFLTGVSMYDAKLTADKINKEAYNKE